MIKKLFTFLVFIYLANATFAQNPTNGSKVYSYKDSTVGNKEEQYEKAYKWIKKNYSVNSTDWLTGDKNEGKINANVFSQIDERNSSSSITYAIRYKLNIVINGNNVYCIFSNFNLISYVLITNGHAEVIEVNLPLITSNKPEKISIEGWTKMLADFDHKIGDLHTSLLKKLNQ